MLIYLGHLPKPTDNGKLLLCTAKCIIAIVRLLRLLTATFRKESNVLVPHPHHNYGAPTNVPFSSTLYVFEHTGHLSLPRPYKCTIYL